MMKFSDAHKLREAGLISDEQQQKSVEHFQLQEEGNRFLVIISFVGALLVAAGLALLIAANWEEIPRGVKLAVGFTLMLGAHGFGWWLREVHGQYPKTREALHVLGSCLFLANIALVGQIYHLSSRPPNANRHTDCRRCKHLPHQSSRLSSAMTSARLCDYINPPAPRTETQPARNHL